MKEIEKLKAGLEYCYDDEEVDAVKQNAIKNRAIYNAIDDADRQKQYDFLSEMLGSVGEGVWIAKWFSCDNGKNIFIGIINARSSNILPPNLNIINTSENAESAIMIKQSNSFACGHDLNPWQVLTHI